jgi:type II secretory pathway component PulL
VHAQVHTLPSPLLNLLAPTIVTVQPINLLQRDYALSYANVGLEKAIYISAMLVGIWFALLTITDLFGYYLLHRESSILSENIRTVYQSVYPNIALPADPKDVLQNELSKLRVSTQDSAFIRLVGSVSTVLLPMTAQGLVPEKATYRDNQLSLELVANDAMILNQLKQSLEQAGLRVVMGSAERSTSGAIKSRFTIEEMS